MAKNPGDVARKWQRNLSASAESARTGVASVTRNPAEAAAAREDAYVQGVQRAAINGKWRRGLQRVTLSDWQRSMTEKGIPRMASGAAAAVGKMETFMSAWLPHMEGLKSKLANMPRGDLEANKARMIAAVDHATQFRRT